MGFIVFEEEAFNYLDANKQATTKLPRYTQSVAWLHSVHLLCTRQSVNGANRDHYTNK